MKTQLLNRLFANNLKLLTSSILILSVIFMVLSYSYKLPQMLDNNLRNLRYNSDEIKPSNNIVLISIGSKSIEDIGEYPWSRKTHANLIDTLQGQNVNRMAFDIFFTSPPKSNKDKEINEIFSNSIKNSDFKIALPIYVDDLDKKNQGTEYPTELISNTANMPTIWMEVNNQGKIENGAYGFKVDGKIKQSFASWLIDEKINENSHIINWSIDYNKIPIYEYSDVISGAIKPSVFKNKTVVIGANSEQLGDIWISSKGERIAGVFAHIISAETMKFGSPYSINENLISILIISLIGMLILINNNKITLLSSALITISLIAMQWFGEHNAIMIMPIGQSLIILSFFIISMIAVNIIEMIYGTMNKDADTGMPNIIAMKTEILEDGYTLVLNIKNNIDIMSTCGNEAYNKIMLKVARNIEIANGNKKVYKISNNQFAWRGSNDYKDEIHNMEMIMQFLRPGITFANGKVDIYNVIGIAPPIKNIEEAINKASVAANRAIVRGSSIELWKENDGEETWRATVVSEIDQAIKNDNLWIAYQPKINPRNNKIIGAEALIRWNHPEKGMINPDSFIPLLEKANRIENLTFYVLDRAIRDIKTIETNLNIAVNISPLIIGKNILYEKVKENLIKYNIPPNRLTLEVTESELIQNKNAIRELNLLKSMGVGISIDDYGTGHSTINYIKLIPATEIKIDRSFISNSMENQCDRVVISSTIKLAHKMGLKVVAEGVEDHEVKAFLSKLNCDVIQGYLTGRPMSIESFRSIIEDQIEREKDKSNAA